MKEFIKKNTHKENGGEGQSFLSGATWYGVEKLLFVRLGIAAVLLLLGLLLQLGDGVSLALLLISVLLSGFDVLYTACARLIKEHSLGEELLISIVAILAFTINAGYEAAAVMLIYQAGCILRAYASALTKAGLRDRVDPYVDSVTVLRGEENAAVAPEDVQMGDILLLERGQSAPADLEILEGSATIDYAPIFGHSSRRELTVGQKIHAGAMNMSAAVRCTVLAPASESVFASAVSTVSDPEAVYGPETDSVDRYSRVYAPFAIGVSVLIALLLLIFSTAPTEEAIHRALVLLIIACPTAFLAPLPIMYLSGLFRALHNGVVVKDAYILDGLSRAGAAVFDKDEMLSTGLYRVSSVKSERLDPAVLLKVAAHAEAASQTPVALSIARAYGQSVDNSLVEEFTEEENGVSAKIEGIEIRIGTLEYMQQYDVEVTDPVGESVTVFIALNNMYAGCIYLSDIIRDDARGSFNAVSGAGCNCIMFSSDTPEKTRAAAAAVGVSEFYAECMPMERLEKIQEIKERYPANSVLYIGESGGDTACLSAADIGVTVNGLASEESMQTGNAVIMDNTASPIAGAIDAAKATHTLVHQALLVILVVKLILFGLALLGVAYQLWFAALIDVVIGVAGILFSSRIWNMN